MSEQQDIIVDSSIQAPRNSGREWMRGFLQILTQPAELNALRGANVWKIAAMALLMFGIVFSLTHYFEWSSAELRQQAQLRSTQKLPDTFSFTQTLAYSIVFQGMFSLVLTSISFFVIHRIFTKEPLRFLAFMGIVGYSFSIVCIGMVATTLLKLLMHNFLTDFSLSFSVPYTTSPYIFGFLSRLDAFLVWQYIAITFSITSFTDIKEQRRVFIVLLAVIMWIVFIGSITYFSYSLAAVSR